MKDVGMRKAALALAAMHPADRRWMLGKLPERAREALAALIDEARQHTVLDADILHAVLTEEPVHLARELPPPDVLIVVLDRLSVVWAARVLRAAAMDHAEIYLSTCAPLRAKAIRDEMSRLPAHFPPALADALSAYLSEAGLEIRAAGSGR